MKRLLSTTLLIAIFAGGAALFLDWVPDDTYISYRYAAQFAQGHGLVFNPGEWVEGFSNFVWTITLGLLAIMGVDIETAGAVMSIIAALAFVIASLQLVRFVGSLAGSAFSESVNFAMGLVVVCSLPAMFYASAGLETLAAAFLVVVGVLGYVRGENGGRQRNHIISIVAFLGVALLRPEGIAFFLTNASILIIRYRGKLVRRTTITLVICAAVFLCLSMLRYSYYGSILPNTYFAKPSANLQYFAPIPRGILYLARFVVISGLALLAPGIGYALRSKKTRATALYLATIVAVQVAFIIFVGADILYFDRFTLAFHTPLIALGALGFHAARSRRRQLATTGAWIVAFVSIALNGERIRRALDKECQYDWMHTRIHRPIGKLLAQALPPGATIVLNEVGAIPYHTDARVVDMIGLTDREVGKIIFESYLRSGTTNTQWCGNQIGEYVARQSADLLIVPSHSAFDPWAGVPSSEMLHPIWEGVLKHADIGRRYQPLFSIQFHESKYFYFYLRNGVRFDLSALASFPQTKCAIVTQYDIP